MGVLEVDNVKHFIAAPVNYKALVGNAIWEKPVVWDLIVIACIIQDCLGDKIVLAAIIPVWVSAFN